MCAAAADIFVTKLLMLSVSWKMKPYMHQSMADPGDFEGGAVHWDKLLALLIAVFRAFLLSTVHIHIYIICKMLRQKNKLNKQIIYEILAFDSLVLKVCR